MGIKVNSGDETIEAVGSATDIDITVTPKGAGNVVLDVITYPNAVGASGQIIETDGAGNLSFAGRAGPGEWEPLGSQLAASQTNVDFVLPSGYREFRVYYYNVIPVTNDVGFRVQISNTSGSTFIAGGGYKSVAQGADSLATTDLQATGGLGFWELTESTSANRGVGNDLILHEGCSGVLHIMKPLESALRTRMRGQIQYTAAANTEWAFHFGGAHTTIETHDAIRFRFQSGDIAVGEFFMQGLKN